jgi:hypothetical protein
VPVAAVRMVVLTAMRRGAVVSLGFPSVPVRCMSGRREDGGLCAGASVLNPSQRPRNAGNKARAGGGFPNGKGALAAQGFRRVSFVRAKPHSREKKHGWHGGAQGERGER